MHQPPTRSLLLAGWLLCSSVGLAQALPPGFNLEIVHTGLEWATALRFAPDGRLFHLELSSGRIRVFPSPHAPSATTWATVPVYPDGERGLLGLALHWDFPDSPYVYVFHTNPSPLVNRVTRLTDQGGVGTEAITFADIMPATAPIHHGGRLEFGPDRMLYVTTGDAFSSANAQNPSSPAGKILRLGPDGKAAPGNPFGADNPAALMGVRNVFGLCFDPLNGTGYFTENGPECDDELNVVTLGANYGWGPTDFCGGQPAGSHPWIAVFNPVIVPTGCTLYRGDAYPVNFRGNLFFGSYFTTSLRRVKFQAGSNTVVDTMEIFASIPNNVLDVTVGPDGNLWFCSFSTIYRIVGPGPVAVDPGRDPVEATIGPNPFRDEIALTVHGGARIDRFEVHDVSGRRQVVRDGPLEGRVLWDGRNDRGQPVPPGVYVLTATASDFKLTRRVVRLGR